MMVRKRLLIICVSISAVAAVILLIAGFGKINSSRKSFRGANLVCAINLKEYDDTSRGFITGFNYILAKQFAQDLGADVAIRLVEKKDHFLDSLLEGSVDIVIIPLDETFPKDSVAVSKPLDSLTVWAVSRKNRRGLKEINNWMDSIHTTQTFARHRHLFTDVFNNPSNVAKLGRERCHLSPYDEIIKEYSAQLGWDWRLLAAIIYQESKFRIEARSHKGAVGLMQLMPAAAGMTKVTDLADPEENIMAGVNYLKYLEHMFRSKAATENDLAHIVVASYNAGQGHILDCMNYASLKGLDPAVWKNLEILLPDMSLDIILQTDTVKMGTFKSDQTLRYVNNVFSTYESFKKIIGP